MSGEQRAGEERKWSEPYADPVQQEAALGCSEASGGSHWKLLM